MGTGIAPPPTPPTTPPANPAGFSLPAPRRTQGHRVIRWVEQNCVHTNGEWIGKPFRFLPWQRKIVYALFEVMENGLRRYRWALLGVPKKSGKTEIAAALGLYLLIGDGEPSPLVVCAAASDEQADLVYGAAKTMCDLSPTLSRITERYEKEILVPSIPGARLMRVAAVAGTNDGKNIHANLLDELHEWVPPKGDKVWNVLTNGTGARRQPMNLQITTAGFDKEGTICGKQYDYGKKVKAGEIDDPRYFFYWVEAPSGADYRDPTVWQAANPSYGTLVHEEFFRDQLGKKTEAVFRRYFLNQWTSSEEIWLPAGAWDACTAPEDDFDPALPVHVGIDVGLRNDSSAVVIAQKQAERTVVRATVWENPYSETEQHALYSGWTVPFAAIEDHLRDIRQRFPVPAAAVDDEVKPGPGFSFDPAFFSRSAQILEGDGLTMIEFAQTDSRMCPASQMLYQLVTEGKLAHDGDPALKRHVENATADQKPRGAFRLSKPKGSRRKIDAVIAAAIAAYQAHTVPVPVPPRSIYETRGLLTI